MAIKAKGGKSHSPKKKGGNATARPIRRSNGPDNWEVRDALSTLERAEQIKSDPKMMKHIEEATKRLSTLVSNAKRKERT